ncbi:MAG: RNA polymerase sigma factor, partial [Tepidisphaeraceae bacterium]
MNDWELLGEFQRKRSQQAFSELVNRYLPLVYGVCRRRLHDSALAEDVTQAVFVLLSRRPPREGKAPLAGWLVKTAHYACANAARGKHTRQLRERESAMMRPEPTTVGADAHPLVDEALANLSESDRDMLLMRYYRDMDLKDVGAALGIPENTAAKRVSRALQRLRTWLCDRGMPMPAIAVTSAIGSIAEKSVPSQLSAQIIGTVAGQATASAASIVIAQGVINMTRMARIRFLAAALGAVVLTGGGLIAVGT